MPFKSKPNEVQAYRFNPNGTPEEILANNPGVFRGEDGCFYVKNKWDASSPFKIDTTKEQMIMMYDGMNDMAVCDGGVFAGSYGRSGGSGAPSVRCYFDSGRWCYFDVGGRHQLGMGRRCSRSSFGRIVCGFGSNWI